MDAKGVYTEQSGSSAVVATRLQTDASEESEMKKDAIRLATEATSATQQAGMLSEKDPASGSGGPSSVASSAAAAHANHSITATHSNIAAQIKRFFDKKYGPTWHVIVGTGFSAYVTYESKTFLFFYIGKLGFMIYKVG